MTDTIADKTIAGWRRLAAVLTNGTDPGGAGYEEPHVDRHPPYASGSFHDGWVRVCAGDREVCRVRPERDGRRNTDVAAALAGVGPALHAAADEVARLRVRVAELQRLLTGSTDDDPCGESAGWREDAGGGVAGPRRELAGWPAAADDGG
jgi:hypothetical protein